MATAVSCHFFPHPPALQSHVSSTIGTSLSLQTDWRRTLPHWVEGSSSRDEWCFGHHHGNGRGSPRSTVQHGTMAGKWKEFQRMPRYIILSSEPSEVHRHWDPAGVTAYISSLLANDTAGKPCCGPMTSGIPCRKQNPHQTIPENWSKYGFTKDRICAL